MLDVKNSELLTVPFKAMLDLLIQRKVFPSALQDFVPGLSQSCGLQEQCLLQESRDVLQDQQLHLYTCKYCGERKIVSTLLKGEDRLHTCDQATLRAKGRLSKIVEESEVSASLPLGLFEFQGTGTLEELLLWSHSLSLGLHDPFKGI